MLLARARRLAGDAAAFGLGGGQRRLQIFDPGARIGERRVALGCRMHKPRVLARHGGELFVQVMIGNRALVVLLIVRAPCRALSVGNLLLQRIEAGAQVGKRTLARCKLLRQKRILGGEALGPPLQNVGVRGSLQSLQGLSAGVIAAAAAAVCCEAGAALPGDWRLRRAISAQTRSRSRTSPLPAASVEASIESDSPRASPSGSARLSRLPLRSTAVRALAASAMEGVTRPVA
jgi:hypothetical protein